MNAEAMNSVEIDKNCKDKAKEENINISEDTEATLEEKTETEELRTILVVDKYGIRLTQNNYIVGKKNPKYNPADKRSQEFVKATFHPTLHQALIQLSKRILEDKLKDACREKPSELKELANLIKEHHEYFVSLTKGL